MSSTITITQETLNLRGYGGTIENVKHLTPFSVDTPVEKLRARFNEDGVLWVKGLLNRDTVKKFRGDYLSFVDQGSEMLKPNTDPVEGIFSGNDWRNYVLPGAVRLAMGLEDEGPFVENSVKSHVAPWYIDFKDQVAKEMESFVGKLFNFEDPWCLPRSLLRSSVPGSEGTPVHYDQIYLRAGPPTSVTAWVPVGDIEVKGGGLIYLHKSHDIGRKYEEDFSKLSESFSDEEKISAVNRNMNKGGWLDRDSTQFGKNWGRDWLVGGYEAGDVVFHHPYTIHASAINESAKDHIRVSTDLRFVDKSKPFDQRWTITAFSDEDPNLARKLPKKMGKDA
ncbi:uncharacterized protein TRUGW13939_09277 [Talaromyces rugulosus]|uniref:Uncharacterized protein n=1 Tax=Talaromyces rugulosus TaxID=121627 RepID=A0A7H8R8V8_TALRU|nr:uncharacterized protein TRUGW13939_09277 [Talaromyces rugulosus]QKX62121.1 hypothetical protein TRUGW13939_09277 [Talaromyces rugulosus]